MNLGTFDALTNGFEKMSEINNAANDVALLNLGDKIGVQQNCQSGALLVMDTFSGKFNVACPGGSGLVMLV